LNDIFGMWCTNAATNGTPIQAQLRAHVLPFEAGGARLRGATALSIRDAASRVCGSSMFV
jgi:hypothetical protein